MPEKLSAALVRALEHLNSGGDFNARDGNDCYVVGYNEATEMRTRGLMLGQQITTKGLAALAAAKGEAIDE